MVALETEHIDGHRARRPDPLQTRELAILAAREHRVHRARRGRHFAGQADVDEIFESNLLAGVGDEVSSRQEEGGTRGDRAIAELRKVGVVGEGDVSQVERIALDLDANRVGNERPADRRSIDSLAVLRVEGFRRDLNVGERHAEGEDELSERFHRDSPTDERTERPRPRVGEAIVKSGLYLLVRLALRDLCFSHAEDPPVQEGRSRDPEEVPDVPLHPVLHDQVLPPEHVRDAQFDVVNGPREFEHRPDAVLAPYPRVVDVADPQKDSVTERRVRVGHVGPQPKDRLSRGVRAAEHLLPFLEGLGDCLRALGARHPGHSVLPQELLGAATHVRPALLDHPACPGVEQRDPVRLEVDRVRAHPREFAVAPDEVEELGLDAFLGRADRIVENEQELPIVSFPVELVDEQHPRVADVEDSARERGHSKDHLTADGSEELGEIRRLVPRDPRGLDRGATHRSETILELGLRQSANLGDNLRDEGTYRVGVRAQGGIGGEQPADDRPRLGGPAVSERVLKGCPAGPGLDLGREHHVRADLPAG